MGLLFLGLGIGIAGGLFPSALHLVALTQVALNRWMRAVLILVALPLMIDGVLLCTTLFFYQYIPHHVAHYVAFAGGGILVGYGGYSIWKARGKSRSDTKELEKLTYSAVSAAALAELAAPGTWIYWIAIAGPVLAEGRQKGYWHVVPFFAGGLIGYYGAAITCVWLIFWGVSAHQGLKKHLFTVANFLLLILGLSYLLRAYWGA